MGRGLVLGRVRFEKARCGTWVGCLSVWKGDI